MTATEFTLKLLFLFFPGIISFLILDSFTDHRKAEVHHWVVYSFALGVCDYLIYYLICRFCYGAEFLMAFQRIANGDMTLDFVEIAWVSLIAILFGAFVTAAINRSWIFNFVSKIGISNKYSEPSLLNYLICRDLAELDKWVRIRDFENDIIYEGYIKAYSDPRENVDALTLKDTRVYVLSSGEHIYDVNVSYIPIKQEKMIVEFFQDDKKSEGCEDNGA